MLILPQRRLTREKRQTTLNSIDASEYNQPVLSYKMFQDFLV
jgi:hypothetical protein